MLVPYLNNTAVLSCPSVTNSSMEECCDERATLICGARPSSVAYGWNIGNLLLWSGTRGYDGLGCCYWVTPNGSVSLGEVADLSDTVLAADCVYEYPCGSSYPDYRVFYYPGWDASCYHKTFTYASTVHNGGANYVFVDGHSKWFAATKMSSDSAAPMYTCSDD